MSRIPISFWHILLDELARVQPTTRRAKLTLELQPVYEQLLKLLLRKCELPDPATLDVDEQEDLRCYRQDIADCYVSYGRCERVVISMRHLLWNNYIALYSLLQMYIATTLSTPVFHFFIGALETAINQYPETKNARVIEASLFALNSIGNLWVSPI